MKVEEADERPENEVMNPYAPNESSVQMFNPYADSDLEPKLSFFAADVPTYAVPRIPKSIPSWQDVALNLLRKESKELQKHMRLVYNVQLEISPSHSACLFPTTRRWLKGEEYGFLIRHYFAYSKILRVHELCDQHHPHMVYKQPRHGALYFIRGLHLQDFGFPRVRIPTGARKTVL